MTAAAESQMAARSAQLERERLGARTRTLNCGTGRYEQLA